MTLPRMLPKKPKRDGRIRSQAHLRWVRAHLCCVANGNCEGPIEAAHVRTGTGGGTGLKPGDNWAISLCRLHHGVQHQRGEGLFETTFGIDMKALAVEFWARSPHRRAAEGRR